MIIITMESNVFFKYNANDLDSFTKDVKLDDRNGGTDVIADS